jgi:hypothetical protein
MAARCLVAFIRPLEAQSKHNIVSWQYTTRIPKFNQILISGIFTPIYTWGFSELNWRHNFPGGIIWKISRINHGSVFRGWRDSTLKRQMLKITCHMPMPLYFFILHYFALYRRARCVCPWHQACARLHLYQVMPSSPWDSRILSQSSIPTKTGDYTNFDLPDLSAGTGAVKLHLIQFHLNLSD